MLYMGVLVSQFMAETKILPIIKPTRGNLESSNFGGK